MTTTPRGPPLHQTGSRWLPFVQFGAVALWLVWGLAPPSVVPYAGFWVDMLVPPFAFGLLFVYSAFAMYRGTAPRGVAAWVGLSAISVVLALEAFFLFIIATFPSDF